MSIKKRFFQAGQSIIEVLIATGVVALVMTALMATMTLSLQNSSQSKYRSLATKIGQEGMESFRQFRDELGWETFYEVINSQGDGMYCLNTTPATIEQLQALSYGTCTDFPISRTGVAFQREVDVQIISADRISFQVTVTWQDGLEERNTTLTQEFNNWR